jgi:hypothetical protein
MTDKKVLPELDTGEDMVAMEKTAMLDQLKVQANLLGVNFAANIGFETLAERVRAFKVTHGIGEAAAAPLELKEGAILETSAGLKVPDDVVAQYAIFRAKQLIRVSIVCVNPAKSDLESDLYTVFSSSIGRVSQVIPYQAPDGYHIPRCLADFLKEKKFVAFRPTKRKKGETGVDREHFEMSEFIITPLPPLTAQEYNKITIRQDRLEAVMHDEDY